MLQLFYNNQPIDIEVSDAEMQQTSPLFNVEQSVAEYSTPITIKYSDRNNVTLAFYFLELTRKQQISLPVTVFENETYSWNATLVIESSSLHRDFAGKTSLTGYLLLNVSDFFQLIKDKKLTDLTLGGVRAFEYTSGDPTDETDGYWQHFQNTWNFEDDYVFAPVHNPMIDGNNEEGSPEWMNQVASGNLVTSVARVYPFIKLKYILEHILIEDGWKADFSGINDDDWEKLVLFPTGSLEVQELKWHLTGPIGGAYTWVSVPVPMAVIYIELNKFLSPNYNCSSFILQTCKRFGWAPVIDNGTKTCRFVALKENASFAKKDWTKYAQPESTEDYSAKTTVYSFQNNFTGNDGFSSDESLSDYTDGGRVASKFDLPAIGDAYDNVAIFCEQENQWYRVGFAETTRFWEPFRNNIYDDQQDNSTTDVSTDVTTLPIYWTLNETRSDIDYYILVPYCEQPRQQDAGLRTLFYWGLVKERLSDNTEGTYDYPFASSVNVKPDDVTTGAWANVFKFPRGDDEFGIEEYWYKKWTAVIQSTDVVRRFNLPLHELLNFKWNEKILCNNISFLITGINRPLPYTNFIEANMRRLVTVAGDIPGVVTGVFLRMEMQILATDVDGLSFDILGLISYYDNATTGYAWARTYADEDATVPLSTSLTVKFRQRTYHDGVLAFTNDYAWALSGTQLDMNAAVIYHLLEYDYTNNYGQAEPQHVEITYELLEDAAYTII